MKMYQYKVAGAKGQQEEIWVCEECRKANGDLIFDGRWKLIGKEDNAEQVCARCVVHAEAVETQATESTQQQSL